MKNEFRNYYVSLYISRKDAKFNVHITTNCDEVKIDLDDVQSLLSLISCIYED